MEHSNTLKYRVYCYLPGHYINEEVECDLMTVKDGAYSFWNNNEGNMEIFTSYPVNFTIIERMQDE